MSVLSQTLSNLVVLAEEVMTRPVIDHARIGDRFRQLAAEVRAADARPAEGQRLTSAAVIMIAALSEYRFAPQHQAAPWLILIGATLPLLRQAAFDAFAEERERRA